MQDEQTKQDLVNRVHEEELQNAWSGLLNQAAGRLILWSILDLTGYSNHEFFGDERDSFANGKRSVGGDVLERFVFPHGMKFYTDMLLEAEQRNKQILRAIEEDTEGTEE
ncbi:hypothetical protein [uncultured Cohaesibacter sp.]|uniref:hypothetical protein n=1 Tax=uncultured Cohaesibacter sp. TaxID=1002546 RepID=UPI00292E4B4D|nr:hypothetical protein [uncultured Cohaesibacter sp.]